MTAAKTMDAKSKESVNCIGRRGFIRSLFGLTGTAVDTVKAQAASTGLAGEWIWGNLRTGQVGFPSGWTQRQYRPGSTMKIIATAALSQEGLVSPAETVDCTGTALVHHQKITCQHAHGRLNLTHALGQSCNVYFAHMSMRLNGHIFGRYAETMGLHSPAAKRQSGLFPVAFKDESLQYVLGLAEDLQPNALQLMRLSALVAMRGKIPFLHSAEDLEGHEVPESVEFSDVTWKTLSDGMRLCVTDGTAKKLDPEDRMHIAAKTGTAQHGTQFQSWITGFFPFEEPHTVFCIWSPSGTSQDAAVPFAKKVLFSTTW
jgi:cell division protein FtsI/penicillin-binding protein 2